MTIPERKEVKKEEDSDDADDEAGEGDDDSAADSDADAAEKKEPATEVAIDEGPPKMIEKQFRARGHLLVTVPIYVKWDQYKWNQR